MKHLTVIDVEAVPVESSNRGSSALERQDVSLRYEVEGGAQPDSSASRSSRYPRVQPRRANPKGRLDIAVYRVAEEHLLPFCEKILGLPGIAKVLLPHAEALIAETIPALNIFEAPRPRRRLR